MSANTNTDTATGAVVMTYTVPPDRPTPAPHRENDGSRQLVGYPGWKTIIERLATRRP